MLDMSRVKISKPAYGLIVASDGDIITINGTATHTGKLSFEILRVGQPELNGTNVKIQAFCSKGVISGIYGLRTKSESAIAVYMHLVEGTSYDVVFRVTVSAETLTEYVPYDSNSTSQTLTLSSTIYGGSVDVATATGEETWQLLPLDGNTVKFASSADGAYWNLPAGSAPGIAYGGQESTLCSHFHQVFSSNPNGFIFTKPERFTGTFDTIDALNAYISAQYAASTPVTIAYKLAAPTHYQVTGIGEVTALAGVNTISTDADQVTVTWHEAVRADVKDVQVAGNSVLDGGVANVPFASINKPGVINIGNARNSGIYIDEDGYCYISYATKPEIDGRNAERKTIVCSNLDYAVKAAMCDSKGAAWTSDEQKAARERMGLDKSYELIEEIVLEEEATVSRRTEPDGTAYNFCAMALKAEFPAVDKSGNIPINFRLGTSNHINSYFISPYDESASKYGFCRCWLDGTVYRIGCWTCVHNVGEHAYYYENPIMQNKYFASNGNISDVSIGVPMPVGTKITIYGVRA